MTLDELFGSRFCDMSWETHPYFRSQYVWFHISHNRLAQVFRHDVYNRGWLYDVYETKFLPSRPGRHWSDLEPIEAQCVLYELWKSRTWYMKLWHYLRSKRRNKL